MLGSNPPVSPPPVSHPLAQVVTQARSLIELSPTAIVVIDLDFNIFELNPAAECLLGYTTAEVAGAFYPFVCLQDQEILWHACTEVISGESVVKSNTSRIQKNGNVCQIKATLATLSDQSGQVVGMVEFLEPVDAQGLFPSIETNSEPESLTPEPRLTFSDSMFESGPVVIFRCEAVSPHAILAITSNITQFGYTPQMFLSGEMASEDLVHPDDRERVWATFEAWKECGYTPNLSEFYYRLVCADGSVRWVYDYTVPVRDETGTLIAFDGYLLDITSQKLAEEALRESESRFRNIVNTLPQMVGLVGHDLRYQFVNNTYLEFFGLERSQIVGKTVPEIIGRKVFAVTRPYIEQALIGHKVHFEQWLSLQVGKRCIEGYLIPHYSEAGEIKGYFTVLTDITSAKATEAALRDNAETYENLLSTTMDGFCIINDCGQFVDANDVYCQMMGYSLIELRSMSIRDVEAKNQDDEIADHLKRIFEVGSDRFETRNRTRDGRVIDIEISCTCLITKRQILVFVRDITARKQTAEQLRISEERLALALNGADLGLWDWDIQNNQIFANEKWAAMLGYQLDQTRQIPWDLWEVMIHPDDFVPALNAVTDHFNGVTPVYEAEYRLKSKAGTWTWVLAKGKVIATDYHGKPLRMAGTSLDITERKTLEVQLRQAQKMEAIGRLAGSIAHDFNNLLTVMMGLTNVLQQRLPQDHVCVPYVDQLRKVSERGAALTQQLLIFSRKQVVKLEPTQLNAAIGELQTMLGRLIGENIELAVVLDPDLGLTNADSGQLEQVILNLVINARDAMPNGGHLVIKTINCDVDEDFTQWHPEVKPGRYVVLSIADDGLGMDDQTKSCIFEPFFTTKTPEKGTGLGLAIVYGIVKQSGGHILVDSQVGQGTRFSLYFPRLQTGKLPETNQSPEPVHQKGDETILVAEDDTDIRELIHEFLTEAGYRVITASDGVDALGKVAEYQEKIHLLVTDVRMPRMDGAELVQKLLLHNADLKVLYISGYADLPALKKNDRGNHVLLQKPFHPGTLLGKIQEILRKA